MHSGLLYNEVGLGQYLYGSKIMKERNVCKANVQRLPLMLLSLLQLVAGMVVAPTRKVCKDRYPGDFLSTLCCASAIWLLDYRDLRVGGRASPRRYSLVCRSLEGNLSCDGGSRLKRALMRNNKSSLHGLKINIRI